MRIIKKLVLALFAVGLLSSLSMAASVEAKVKLTVYVDSDNTVHVSLPPEDEYTEYDFGTIERVLLNGEEVDVFSGSDNWYEFNITDYVDKWNLSAAKYDKIGIKIEDLVVKKLNAEGEVISQKADTGEGEASLAWPLYRQSITKTGSGRVYVAYDITGETTDYSDDDYYEIGTFYAYKGDRFWMKTAAASGYTFDSWTSGRVTKVVEDEDNVHYEALVEGSTTYTAAFRTGATGVSLKATSGKKTSDASGAISVTEGDTIKFEWTKLPDKDATYHGTISLDYPSEYFDRVSDTELKAKKATYTGTPAKVKVKCNPDTLTVENSIYVTINEKAYNENIFNIKASESYLTDGYGMNLLADFTKVGNIYNGIVWRVVEGEGTLTGLSNFTGTERKEVTDLYGVELKATEGKVESGKTGTIKVTATLPQGKSKYEDAVATISITVYPKNTIGYNDSEKTLSCTSPSKVNTGNTDGVDGDNKDVTKTAISDVKGVKLHVLKDDKFLGLTSVAKDKGTSATIDATTLRQMIHNVRGNLSGDITDITIRAFPCDGDGKYNKRVYASKNITVYRVVITYTKADGTTGEMVTYAQSGQRLNVSDLLKDDIKASDGSVTMVDGGTDTNITVSTTPAQNKHTAVLGVRNADAAAGAATAAKAGGAAADSRLDKVPKTGQSNVFVYVMVAIVGCAVAAGLYAYNRKSKSNIR